MMWRIRIRVANLIKTFTKKTVSVSSKICKNIKITRLTAGQTLCLFLTRSQLLDFNELAIFTLLRLLFAPYSSLACLNTIVKENLRWTTRWAHLKVLLNVECRWKRQKSFYGFHYKLVNWFIFLPARGDALRCFFFACCGFMAMMSNVDKVDVMQFTLDEVFQTRLWFLILAISWIANWDIPRIIWQHHYDWKYLF